MIFLHLLPLSCNNHSPIHNGIDSTEVEHGDHGAHCYRHCETTNLGMQIKHTEPTELYQQSRLDQCSPELPFYGEEQEEHPREHSREHS